MDSKSKDRVEKILIELSSKCFQEKIDPIIVKEPFIGAEAKTYLNTIKLSEWMVDFPDPELKSVLAHEVGHIALKTITKYELLATILPKTTKELIILTVLLFINFFLQSLLNLTLLEFFSFLSIQVFIFVFIKTCILISVRGELNADIFAILLVNDPKTVFSALNLFKMKSREISRKTIKKKKFKGILFKFNPFHLFRQYIWKKELLQRELQMHEILKRQTESKVQI